MAFRFENNELIFDGWERGIGEGPYSIFSPSALGSINQNGITEISYANIYSVPGEVSVAFPLKASTIAGSPVHGLRTPIQITTEIESGNGGTVTCYFMLDSIGQIYKSNSSGDTVTWTYQGIVGAGSLDTIGNSGIVWWQGYLFTLLNNAIYYSSDGGVTNTDWTSDVGALVGAGSTLYAISSKVSDAMYFCNGNGVGSLLLTPGATFDPTNAATYTFQGGTNPNAVNIPAYDMATCLAELNGQVLIGGALNRVYPWDANNLSGTGITSLVGLPLFIGDNYVQRIVVTNANAYVFAGHPVNPAGRGYIYITNGSTIDIFQKMPDNLTSLATSDDVNEPYWRFGDVMWNRNKLWFGAVAVGNISNSIVAGTGGVWCLDLTTNALFRANFMTGGAATLATAISPNYTGTHIYGLGYMVGSTGSMNNTTTTLSTSARVITDKVAVGTKFVPKTFEQLELKLATALVSGESIQVFVITDLDPTGHSIGTMLPTDGMSRVFTPLSLSSSSTLQGIQWLQVLCLLTPTNTNPSYVRLREIRLR